MHTDGLLWVLVGVFTAMGATLTSDESYKYVMPGTLYWMKFYIGAMNAGCLALKMFRSTAFAKHLQNNPEPAKHPVVVAETVKEPVKPAPPVIQ